MDSPTTYSNLNNELNQRFGIIVDEIVKTYPTHKANPTINTHSQSYTHNISNLQTLQSDYFMFKNNLSKHANDLQRDIKNIDEMIYELEEDTKALRKEYNSLKNTDNAAHGQLADSKTLYKQQLLGNWLLLITFTGLTYIFRQLQN